LRAAVKKFGDDLNKISENIKNKTINQIKVGIKRKAYDEAGVSIASPVKKVTPPAITSPKAPATKVITKPVQGALNSLNAENSIESEIDSTES